MNINIFLQESNRFLQKPNIFLERTNIFLQNPHIFRQKSEKNRAKTERFPAEAVLFLGCAAPRACISVTFIRPLVDTPPSSWVCVLVL